MTSARFQEYVEELRTFSKFHKVGYGHPHDVMMLTLAVRNSERFRAELSSMVRSVLFREREGVTQAEVSNLVAVAWGGGEGPEPAPEMKPMMGELGNFVREVLSRSPGEPLKLVVEKEPEVEEAEAVPARPVFAAAFAMKEKEDSGEMAIAPMGASPAAQPQEKVRDDPWADGSRLHLELLKFGQWRAAAL